MELEEYQTKAHHTANYKQEPYMRVGYGLNPVTNHVPAYPFIKVMAESAEIAEPAIKSALRGDEQPVDELELEKEIGDLLWYCAEMSTVLGVSLDYIARKNLDKLADRANRNKIHGSGDDR